MKKTASYLLLVLIAFGHGGCSHLTSRGRQEAAYARYVRRASAGRIKMQRKLAAFPKLPKAQPASEPAIAASESPESVSASNESQ